MKLIDLLVKELPQHGGWPDGVDAVEQDREGQLFEMESDYCSDFKLEKCDDWISDVVTKQQYESALAAREGWIEWAGGECPVDSDAIVEVKFRSTNPYQYNNDRAGDFAWVHTGSRCDIIAYRLHDQNINNRTNDDRLEQDLNECIGQGVAAEWDGEGLPPAGCECEARYRTDNAEWAFFRCVGVDCGVAFGWSGKEAVTLGIDSYEFRPLRTEADKKRQVAAQALCDSCGGTGKVDESLGFGIMWFDVYDAIAAGKIPGVKLEGK